jgi:protein-tyrosine phosphatase
MNFEVHSLELSFNQHLSTTQQLETRPDYSPARDKQVASKIAPRLYLSCLATASDVTQLTNLGITHVVSLIEDPPDFPSTFPLRTLHVPVFDYPNEDILTHLPATTSFIRSALAESPSNCVLVCTAPGYSATLRLVLTATKQVHCFMGISRSATAVIAYLIATTKMTPREALAAVRAKRAIVRPNRGYMSQLQEYYSKYSNSLQANLAEEPPDKNCNGKQEEQEAPRGYACGMLGMQPGSTGTMS